MGYFNYYIIKKLINSFFRYIRKNKKFIIIFIIFVCILFIKEKCFAATAVTGEFDVEREILKHQETCQTEFAYFCYYPYIGNTEFWQDSIKPFFDDILSHSFVNNNVRFNTQDFYILRSGGQDRVTFDIYLYNVGFRTDNLYRDYTSRLNNTTYTILQCKYNINQYLHYRINWYPSNNTGDGQLIADTTDYYIPYCANLYKATALQDFIKMYKSGNGDYASMLSSMNTTLDNIEDIDTDILSLLQTMSSSLSQVSQNTSTDYSQGISQISSKISDLLTDNDTIISQNSQMIQQQEDINDNLEEVNDSVQELKDTITDDIVESGASDLPSTNVSDPTQTGIDNIFQSIYNAFCVGQAQDIVFPIPFTEKNITLSPYYVRDMLNNNGASWVYTLIQAFWGYLIGRFIVYDIMKKMTKIKSGNIEELETNNIKGDML